MSNIWALVFAFVVGHVFFKFLGIQHEYVTDLFYFSLYGLLYPFLGFSFAFLSFMAVGGKREIAAGEEEGSREMKRKEAGGKRKRKKGLLSTPVRSKGQKERERKDRRG